MKKIVFLLGIILVYALIPNDAEAQCAMCKATVESSQGQTNSVAGGINQGILYLMAVPYLLIAFIFRKQIINFWNNWRGKTVSEEEN